MELTRVSNARIPRVPDPARGSVLLSGWFFAVVIVVAVGAITALVVFEVVRRLRHAHPPRWRVWTARVMLPLVFLAFGLTAVADEINRHFQYIPSFSALTGHFSRDLVNGNSPYVTELTAGAPFTTGVPPHGIVLKVKFVGQVSHVKRIAYIYLPREYYEPAYRNRRFPTLYLLHGSPGEAPDWLRGGFVDVAMDRLDAAHDITPFIVVLPDVNGGYTRDTECQDIVGGPHVQTFLAIDLPHYIDAHFRTLRSARYRAIGGLSTGGYCGLNLMLRHQDVFSAAIMHSGEVVPIEGRYTGSLWGGDPTLRLENSPVVYIPTMRILHPIAVYCDAGTSDLESVRACVIARSLLTARGVPVTVNIVDNEGHTFKAWRTNLYFSLPWVSRWFDTRVRLVGTHHRRHHRHFTYFAVRAPQPQSSSVRSMSVAQISNSPLR